MITKDQTIPENNNNKLTYSEERGSRDFFGCHTTLPQAVVMIKKQNKKKKKKQILLGMNTYTKEKKADVSKLYAILGKLGLISDPHINVSLEMGSMLKKKRSENITHTTVKLGRLVSVC